MSAHTAESDAPCRCEPYAHIGTQMAGTPTRCERCHGLVDEVAEARLDAAHAKALARLTRVTAPTPTAESRAATITIPKPQIFTGPKHQTVDEATASYLREAAKRVRDNRYWGSGVTALVATLLDDAADAVTPPAHTTERDTRCLCDGAAYFTDEQNATRYPFLRHSECPVHSKFGLPPRLTPPAPTKADERD